MARPRMLMTTGRSLLAAHNLTVFIARLGNGSPDEKKSLRKNLSLHVSGQADIGGCAHRRKKLRPLSASHLMQCFESWLGSEPAVRFADREGPVRAGSNAWSYCEHQ